VSLNFLSAHFLVVLVAFFPILIKFETKYTTTSANVFLLVSMARGKKIEADRISNIFPMNVI
jgi:hypothetical protein